MIIVENASPLEYSFTGDPLDNLLLAMTALAGLAGYLSLLLFIISGFAYWLSSSGFVGRVIRSTGWEAGYKKYWGDWARWSFWKMIIPKVLVPVLIYKAAMLQGDYFLAMSLSGLVAGLYVAEAVKEK